MIRSDVGTMTTALFYLCPVDKQSQLSAVESRCQVGPRLRFVPTGGSHHTRGPRPVAGDGEEVAGIVVWLIPVCVYTQGPCPVIPATSTSIM